MIKTRFAPSPTGFLHIGSVRTALFSYLHAKRYKGKFLLRIEDTDLTRSKKKSATIIFDGLKWLGLVSDLPPIYQSKRFSRYNEIIDKLLKIDKAYYCNCSQKRLEDLRKQLKAAGKKPKYDNKCRNLGLKSGVIRFKNPTTNQVIFNDLTKGRIAVNNSELDDLIIKRANGAPTYNLTVVVDDHDMGITTIIRGDDHINNTPRQINLYQSLEWEVPQFAHLPLILGDDGTRLSKRYKATNILQYKEDGFLPQALLNYLARLGWSYKDQEIFSLAELIKLFAVENVNSANAKFDKQKLVWLNSDYIKKTPANKLLPHLQYHLKKQSVNTGDKPHILTVITLLQPRAKTLVELAAKCRMFYHRPNIYDKKLKSKYFTPNTLTMLINLNQKLSTLSNWSADNIEQLMNSICAKYKVGFGNIGQPFRLVLSGDGIAPDIAKTAELVGKNEVLIRLRKVLTNDF